MGTILLPSQPTSISFRVRATASSGFVGWVAFGDNNVEGNDGLAHIRVGIDKVYVTSNNGSVFPTIDPNTWIRFEFTNINWTKNTFTMTIGDENNVALDIGPNSNIGFWHAATQNMSEIHLFNEHDGFARYDGFLFRE